MKFLVFEIFSLLLLSAVAGGAFVYWWLRRNFREVTHEYTAFRAEGDAWRTKVDRRLEALVDTASVDGRFAALEKGIRGIQAPVSREVDFSPVYGRLDAVERAVKGIHIPAHKEADFGPVTMRLVALETLVKSLDVPKASDTSGLAQRIASLETLVKGIHIPAHKDTDLGPMTARLSTLETLVKGIEIPKAADTSALTQRIASLETLVKGIHVPAHKDTDLTPVNGRLEALEKAVRAIHIPTQKDADFGPLHSRLETLERTVKAIHIPAYSETDLSPVMTRLETLEALVKAIRIPEKAAEPQGGGLQAYLRTGSSNLLSRPSFGPPDDLKRIKGVAKVLEKMLHKIGVYYFWQVAEWSTEDIAYADEQLDAFKGRIERDDWVTQCKAFSRESTAAQKPNLWAAPQARPEERLS